MSIQSDLVEDYSRNSRLLSQHLEGLSHADTLIRPGGTGNCIHWIFGHLLLCRVEMLDLLGGHASVTEKDLERYGNGVEPVGPESIDILPLEQLKSWWATVEGEFMQAIQAASDETMLGIINTGRREMPLHRRLHFYFFHEAFHLGQFETLRHLAGKTESLI
jgi:uncharacterized damage-inducible protein DinB